MLVQTRSHQSNRTRQHDDTPTGSTTSRSCSVRRGYEELSHEEVPDWDCFASTSWAQCEFVRLQHEDPSSVNWGHAIVAQNFVLALAPSSPSSLRGDRERRRRQDVRRHGGSHQSGAMRIRASESVNWGHAIVAQNAVQNHELALVERYFGDSSSWRVCRRNITQTGRRHPPRWPLKT